VFPEVEWAVVAKGWAAPTASPTAIVLKNQGPFAITNRYIRILTGHSKLDSSIETVSVVSD
jgi:hypothetical protein